MQAEQQSERERFEAWYSTCYRPDSLKPMEDGCYLGRGAGMAWDAWQARAALSRQSPQGWHVVVEALERSAEFAPKNSHVRELCEDALLSLKSAGVL